MTMIRQSRPLLLAVLPFALAMSAAATSAVRADPAVTPAWLSDLDLSLLKQEWGEPHKDLSVDSHPLTIAGKHFEHGVGSHATSTVDIDVRGATRFTASVGVDDDAEKDHANAGDGSASIEFVVIGDGKELFHSGVMHMGDAAKPIDLPLAGVKHVSLRIRDGGDGNGYDHGDWADARFDYVGQPPIAIASSVASSGPPVVFTPKPEPAPRINGARTFGARPGLPVLIKIPCTGTKPITYSVEGLPNGLTLDAANGIISGSVETKSDHVLTVHAHNADGDASRKWTIKIDDAPGTLAQTPPMGWNSWNVWGMAIDDAKVRAAADSFVSTGLIDHGWTYVNIDDGWQFKSPRDREADFAGEPRGKDGRIQGNKKFPDMKSLADYVHSKGLKVGLYSSPGPRTCGGAEGSFGFEAEDAAQYASWGFDYLKYDMCSYGDYLNLMRRRERGEGAQSEHQLQMAPYERMRDELRKQKRDIVYSLCQYGWDKVWEWGGQIDAQDWRTTGDISDNWNSMSGIGFGQAGHEKFAKPGNWNDPDMLVVGFVGWGPNIRPTHLTPDEQYTHVSLWALLSAPLLIGCDLTRLDDFTIGLLTNDEVIDISQDPLGKQAARVAKDGDREVWAKPLEDGSVAVGLFNRSSDAAEIEVKFSELPLKASGSLDVRDVWRETSIGAFDGSYKVEVPSHGVRLIRVGAKKD